MARKRFPNAKHGRPVNKRQKLNWNNRDSGEESDEETPVKRTKKETDGYETEESERYGDESVQGCNGKNYNNKKHKSFKNAHGQERSHQKKGGKRGRIIVRNLPFKSTEEKLKGHFEEFGAILEVKLLKKADGKLVGCGFVEFAKKQSAIRAILNRSGKLFLGRPIICDWALSKNKYLEQVKSEEEQQKKEIMDEVEIKKEIESEEEEEEENEDEEEKEHKLSCTEWKEEKEEEEIDDHDDDDDEEEEDDDDDDDDAISDNVPDSDEEGDISTSEKGKGLQNKRQKIISNDVTEGCTVFVKNIPFTATNIDLQKCMEKIGSVHYALICVDPLTEHSRGTGFVKFKKKDDADICLEADDLVIKGQNIQVVKALPRNDIKSLDERKKEKKVKDNRHLYLVKEGVILAGSPAAKDVSVSDMEKRLKIEQWKTQMLRNLNMFVSNTRMVIYNVPPTWNDDQIYKLFKENAGRGAFVKEARIMRDLRNVDANGVGKSKEYAFVRFTTHEHALQALRNINNNPNIFSKSKRPIVMFSIENKAIHLLKQKRFQKSRMTNVEKGAQSKNANRGQRHNVQKKEVDEEEISAYSGLQGKPGNKKLRSKFNIKTQAAIHGKNVQQAKRKEKLKRKLREHKKKFVEPQPKKKIRAQHDSFGELVDKYKSKLLSANAVKRWYD